MVKNDKAKNIWGSRRQTVKFRSGFDSDPKLVSNYPFKLAAKSFLKNFPSPTKAT